MWNKIILKNYNKLKDILNICISLTVLPSVVLYIHLVLLHFMSTDGVTFREIKIVTISLSLLYVFNLILLHIKKVFKMIILRVTTLLDMYLLNLCYNF